MTLADLVREAGGWPINIERVALLMRRADAIFADGREHRDELTAAEVAQLTAPRLPGRPAKT